MNLSYRRINLINIQNTIVSSIACKENAFTLCYRKQWFPKETCMTLLMKRAPVSVFKKKKKWCFEEATEVEQNAVNTALYTTGALTIMQGKIRPSEELWTQLIFSSLLFSFGATLASVWNIPTVPMTPSHSFRVTFRPLDNQGKMQRQKGSDESVRQKRNATSLLQPLHVVACAQKHRQLCKLIYFFDHMANCGLR